MREIDLTQAQKLANSDEKVIEAAVEEISKMPLSKLGENFDMHNDFDKHTSTYETTEPIVRQLPNVRLVAVSCPRTAPGGFGVIRDLIYYGPRIQLSKDIDMGRMARAWLENEGLVGFSVTDVTTPSPLNPKELEEERTNATMNVSPNELYKVRVSLINTSL